MPAHRLCDAGALGGPCNIGAHETVGPQRLSPTHACAGEDPIAGLGVGRLATPTLKIADHLFIERHSFFVLLRLDRTEVLLPMDLRTLTVLVSKSTSCHCNASSSPRRNPVEAATSTRVRSRSSSSAKSRCSSSAVQGNRDALPLCTLAHRTRCQVRPAAEART